MTEEKRLDLVVKAIRILCHHSAARALPCDHWNELQAILGKLLADDEDAAKRSGGSKSAWTKLCRDCGVMVSMDGGHECPKCLVESDNDYLAMDAGMTAMGFAKQADVPPHSRTDASGGERTEG